VADDGAHDVGVRDDQHRVAPVDAWVHARPQNGLDATRTQ
jgi:hypothetical protein